MSTEIFNFPKTRRARIIDKLLIFDIKIVHKTIWLTLITSRSKPELYLTFLVLAIINLGLQIERSSGPFDLGHYDKLRLSIVNILIARMKRNDMTNGKVVVNETHKKIIITIAIRQTFFQKKNAK